MELFPEDIFNLILDYKNDQLVAIFLNDIPNPSINKDLSTFLEHIFSFCDGALLPLVKKENEKEKEEGKECLSQYCVSNKIKTTDFHDIRFFLHVKIRGNYPDILCLDNGKQWSDIRQELDTCTEYSLYPDYHLLPFKKPTKRKNEIPGLSVLSHPQCKIDRILKRVERIDERLEAIKKRLDSVTNETFSN